MFEKKRKSWLRNKRAITTVKQTKTATVKRAKTTTVKQTKTTTVKQTKVTSSETNENHEWETNESHDCEHTRNHTGEANENHGCEAASVKQAKTTTVKQPGKRKPRLWSKRKPRLWSKRSKRKPRRGNENRFAKYRAPYWNPGTVHTRKHTKSNQHHDDVHTTRSANPYIRGRYSWMPDFVKNTFFRRRNYNKRVDPRDRFLNIFATELNHPKRHTTDGQYHLNNQPTTEPKLRLTPGQTEKANKSSNGSNGIEVRVGIGVFNKLSVCSMLCSFVQLFITCRLFVIFPKGCGSQNSTVIEKVI